MEGGRKSSGFFASAFGTPPSTLPDLARTGAIGNGERELLEFGREIDADEADVFRKRQRDRGEVHDAGDSGRHELIGGLLGFGCRNGDHAELNVLLVDDFAKLGDVEDGDPLDLRTDHARVAIERSHDAKALSGKAFVAQAGRGPCCRRRPS